MAEITGQSKPRRRPSCGAVVLGLLALQYAGVGWRLWFPKLDRVHDGRRYYVTHHVTLPYYVPFLGLLALPSPEEQRLRIFDAATGELLEESYPDLVQDIYWDHPLPREG